MGGNLVICVEKNIYIYLNIEYYKLKHEIKMYFFF